MKTTASIILTGQRRITIFCALLLAVIFLGTLSSHAFSLLGPFEPWMEETNGLRLPGDIGGPVDINEGYRWNVPEITYGFDPSFINYFGTNGEAAVKSAIQILNNLPPASEIYPLNGETALPSYPYNTTQSFDARALNLLDLKSYTLSLLLEQMGLAQPTRYIFVLKSFNPTTILERNFNPHLYTDFPIVNGTSFTMSIETQGDINFVNPTPLDQDAPIYTAVADRSLNTGQYYSGLTDDDMGGLNYFYSTNNIKYETLLPNIHNVNPGTLVNGALRPGINKISFVPQPVNPKTGKFIATSYRYTDTYITNGVLKHQELSRVVLQPDILFCAGDTGDNIGTPYFDRTGTTNWINNAAYNGNPGGAGPGIIRPQIKIVFNKLGTQQFNGLDEQTASNPNGGYWGSFDGSTNAPIIYPIPQTGTNQTTIRMWLFKGEQQVNFDWKPVSLIGSQFAFQTSTNLVDWTTMFMATNDNTVVNFFNGVPFSASRFYRLIPQ